MQLHANSKKVRVGAQDTQKAPACAAGAFLCRDAYCRARAFCHANPTAARASVIPPVE
ncbi:hypothetical protein GCM10010256_04530 [Streptomyces coeruleorubidus]|nr:hypothetical protein GCM10010256_04530 [Streptomyces coeruleorubidus]